MKFRGFLNYKVKKTQINSISMEYLQLSSTLTSFLNEHVKLPEAQVELTSADDSN